ncbi:MAG: bifunctional precorrin-2 dehydrogenase/sirohydrochlorin ferrochelatase [Haloarculaceae archaeon]
MVPLVHDFTGETVLVFGGGPVGARKARRFAREARVVVVSPAFADAEFGGAERVRAAPDPDDVGGWLDRTTPALAVAATDDGRVNAAVERAAHERGTLVNRADQSGDRAAGSVVVPATVTDEPVVVAVTTGATSPALGRHLRERIEPVVENAGAMARVTQRLREELRDRPATERRAALRAVVRHDDVWAALDDPGTDTRGVVADVVADVTGDPP